MGDIHILCDNCKHHRPSWTGSRYDKCANPKTEVYYIENNRKNYNATKTCRKTADLFEVKIISGKKWWQFWRGKYE